MRTANPALREQVFTRSVTEGRAMGVTDTMTVGGTVNRTFILLLITSAVAVFSWQSFQQGVAAGNPNAYAPFMFGGAILGFIVALVTVFKKTWAPVTAPLYAACEGAFLGGISAMFEMKFPGIVFQAVVGTFGTLFALLAAYRSGLIKATENFKLGVVAATGGIAFVYIISIILGFFGVNIPFINENGAIGILFSLFVVVIAALNLVLDFDFIENGERVGAPKYMEWYAAFGLLVTLVWLYLEMLRLLSKMRSRN